MDEVGKVGENVWTEWSTPASQTSTTAEKKTAEI